MKRNSWKKRVLSLLLALVLVLGSSSIVQAEGERGTGESGYGMTVTLQIEGYGYTLEEGTSVTMPDTYKSFADYGLDVIEPAEQGYTVLHVLAQYCEDTYGEGTAAEFIQCNKDGYVWGMLDTLPEKSTLMFLLNRAGLNVGASQQKVSGGDLVSVVDIWANSTWTIGGQYGWFENSQVTAEAGESFQMKLNAAPLMWGEVSRPGGATVQVYDGSIMIASGVTDSDGYVSLEVDEPGTYSVTAERVSGYYDELGNYAYDLTAPHGTVTVTTPREVTDEEAVQEAKEALSLGDLSNVKSDLTLPTSGKKQTTVTWESDAPEVIEDNGTVHRPTGENATVQLTATIRRGTVSDTKEFEVTVIGYSLRLKSLGVGEGTLSFDPDMENYIVYVPEETKKITISAEAEETFPTVWLKINGNWIFGDTKGEKTAAFEENTDALVIPVEVYKQFNGTKKSTTTITVKRAANPGEPLPELPDVTWGQHLGDKDNNAVSAAKTPTENAVLQWESYSNAPEIWGTAYAGTPILVNGNLYAVRNHKIEMLDAKTGEVKASTALHTQIGYYSNVIYGGGMIFVPLGDGSVQCFHAATLQSMYLISSPSSLGYSMNINGAMHYEDGKLYVGYTDGAFVNPIGCYAAYDTVDLDVDNETELVTPLWMTDIGQSYYGAGAITIGDNAVIAGDSGMIFVLNAATGEEIDSCQLEGSVRGSLVYADGYIWTATQGKKIYKMSLSDNGKLQIVSEEALPVSTNASPVVTGGKVYITGGNFSEGGFFAVYDMDLKLLAKEMTDYALNTPTVTTAYDDIYVYFTENGPEGSLYAARVTSNNKIHLTKLYTPEHPQYCMSKVVAGDDGTLYYGNDAGYLYAIQTKENPVMPEEPENPEKGDDGQKEPEDIKNPGNTDQSEKTDKGNPVEDLKKTNTVSEVKKVKVDASDSSKTSASGIPEAIVRSNEKKEKSLTINNPPEILEKEVFATLEKYPDFQLILDCGNYTMSMKGSDVVDAGLSLSTKLLESDDTLSTEQALKYGNYQLLTFMQEGKTPAKITVVYRLGDPFGDSESLCLYDLSNEENVIRTVIQKPYVMFTLEEGGEYILSDRSEEEAETAEKAMIEEKLIPSDEETGKVPGWAYLLIGICVGGLVGGLVVSKLVSARKKEDTWEK